MIHELGVFLLSAYCSCFLCTGKHPDHPAHGITRWGRQAEQGITAACDPSMRGQVLLVDGLGVRECEDTGRAITGRRLDVYFDNHQAAKAFGVRRARVRRVK
jgi:3D (Asp-Asp-Asp) domain-containing protein